MFINGGSLAYPSTEISLLELNITTAAASVTVTDVWTGDAGPVDSTKKTWNTGVVASLDSKFVIFKATG